MFSYRRGALSKILEMFFFSNKQQHCQHITNIAGYLKPTKYNGVNVTTRFLNIFLSKFSIGKCRCA
jgi:hypothetical protein